MQQSQKIFGFQSKLKEGDKGENFFIKCYKKRGAEKSEIRDYDILIDKNKKVELKSDQYRMADTPNFFFERYRNTETKKPGGPWQSIDCDFFVYSYINDKTFFWFDPKKLCVFLDEEIKKHEPKQIRNRGWSSIGYAISRESCRDLILTEDKF